MQLTNSLRQGILIKRYKRFLADINFGDEILTVHCPNPGAMTGVSEPGLKVWCSKSDNPKRKLTYTLEMVEVEGILVGINTNSPNKIVEEALNKKTIPDFQKYNEVIREFNYEKGTRFDFKLKEKNKISCFIEVKNVQLKRSDYAIAEFPDTVTLRGTKHLKVLTKCVLNGYRAAMIYVIQREDCSKFSIANDIDPLYAENLALAIKNGVEVYAWRCKMSLKEITLSEPLELII